MNKQLIKKVKASNLSDDDKKQLVKLLEEDRKDEYLKYLFKIIGLGIAKFLFDWANVMYLWI